ncbi:NACHT domain-containing protein [Streptomyces sp. NPDC048290]|uniref:NACHT domain-containing protein n=1 Tax=Streptomyces sp. NPDC048290 TaxID=3155811 RepID=UPI003437E38F
MEPAALGARLASSLIAPLVRKLFAPDGPGAGLVREPVRIRNLVAFRGEQRTLGERHVRRLAVRLVDGALDTPGEPPFPHDERLAVTDALTARLLALGTLEMDDVQAVRLGHIELARTLRAHARPADDTALAGLSADAAYFLERVTEWASLQILEYFTRRSTFVARTLVEQTRTQALLIEQFDALLTRMPAPAAEDAAFERNYLSYVGKKHGTLTIFGIDLSNSPDRWPLDSAYLSLEATERLRLEPSGRSCAEAPGRAVAADPLPAVPVSPPSVPADQALDGHDRVLLRGAAGSGKTTLVQWLAVSAATGPGDRMAYLTGRVPFVLPLRTLTRHGERLPAPAAFLTAVGCPLAGAQPDGWETRVLTGGRGLILIDGIDEVPEAERERARAWLRDLLTAFPGNRWLVTSRPSAVREDWLTADGFTEFTLAAMNTTDVTSFVRRWHRAAATGAPDEDTALATYEAQLLQALRTKPDLGRLATNPLLCGLVCALHRDRRGYLPHGRKELYDSALSMLLVRRDRERDMAVPALSEEPQLQILQRLAYWLIRNGRTELDQDRAERIVADALPSVPAVAALGDAAAVLDHFLIRTGLLRSPGPGTLHFVHRTFQDFLGARAAVEAGDLGLLAGHAGDDQWSDVIRMAVAQARPRERAELLDLLTGLPDRRAHLLAMACLEYATELAPEVRARVEERAARLLPPRTADEARNLAEVGPLVLELLPGPEGLSDVEAEMVVATAVLVGTDAAVPVLRRFVEHRSWRVRMVLARAWSRFDTRPYAEEVLGRLGSRTFLLTVTTDAQVRALPLVGNLYSVRVEGDHALSDLIGSLPQDVEYLRLADNPRLSDLRPLRALRSLVRLGLVNCPGVRDLAPLGELRLRELVLLGLSDTRGLEVLDTLTSLFADCPLPGGLRAVSRSAPLSTLGVSDLTVADGGLHGVSQWPTLRRLVLLDARSLPQGWSEVTSLPALRTLEVPSAIAATVDSAPALPGVTRLIVTSLDPAHDLAPLARLCPRTEYVGLYGPRPVSDPDFQAYRSLFPHAEVRFDATEHGIF